MRMSIRKDIRRRTVLTEHMEDFLTIAPFLTTGIQLTVRIGTSATLSEAIVTLSIHLLRLGNHREVFLTFMDILTTLQDNRT